MATGTFPASCVASHKCSFVWSKHLKLWLEQFFLLVFKHLPLISCKVTMSIQHIIVSKMASYTWEQGRHCTANLFMLLPQEVVREDATSVKAVHQSEYNKSHPHLPTVKDLMVGTFSWRRCEIMDGTLMTPSFCNRVLPKEQSWPD